MSLSYTFCRRRPVESRRAIGTVPPMLHVGFTGRDTKEEISDAHYTGKAVDMDKTSITIALLDSTRAVSIRAPTEPATRARVCLGERSATLHLPSRAGWQL
jgi:hypothetical protein